MEEWFGGLGGGSIVMTWRDPNLPGGQRVTVLGSPPCELHRYGGVYLKKQTANEL
jgi:CRISPR-associated protein Cas2